MARRTSWSILSDQAGSPSGRHVPEFFGRNVRQTGVQRERSSRKAVMLLSIFSRDLAATVAAVTPGGTAPCARRGAVALEAEPLWPQRQALLGRSAPHPSAAWGRRAAMLLGPLAERLAGGGPGARQAFLPVVPLGLRLLGRSPSEPAWPMPDVRCHRRPVARGPVGQRPPVGRCHDAHGLTSPAGGGSARPALSLAPASRQPPGGVL
jgi:hypothetical protein